MIVHERALRDEKNHTINNPEESLVFISFISITSEFEQELLALQRDCAAGNASKKVIVGHRRTLRGPLI